MASLVRIALTGGLALAVGLLSACNKRDTPPASPPDQTASAPMGGASAP